MIPAGSLAQATAPSAAPEEAPAVVAPAAADTFSRLYVRALMRYLTTEEQAALGEAPAVVRAGVAFEAADRALRQIAPLALEAVGQASAAGTLRELAQIHDPDSAAAAHARVMEIYPTIPFRRGHGLRVSAAESCLLSAMSAVRMLADASSQRGQRALRSVPDATVRDGLIATQVARTAGQALESVSDRSAVLAIALGLLGGSAIPQT